MTTLTNEQLVRIYRFYATESCTNAERGGTNLLIVGNYLSRMEDVLKALSGEQMDTEWVESALRILFYLDILEEGMIDVNR